ncbi:MAG: PIN domain-containing protein [Cyclobacteriaceae bacterium]
MKGKVFIDTNVLVYLFSNTEDDKRKKCKELIRTYSSEYILVWSTQIVQEFYVVMTTKLRRQPQEVKLLLNNFSEFELVINNLDMIEQAMDIQVINQLSFWDSLVISAANTSRCQILLSEDLNHNQVIQGIKIQNPFKV